MSATAKDQAAKKVPAVKTKAAAPRAKAVARPGKPAANLELRVAEAKAAHYQLARATAASLSSPAPPMVGLLLPGTNTDDRMAVFKATKAGFPLSAVIDLIESVEVFRRYNVLAKIVGLSDRTLARRMKKQDEALTPEQSARALYYAEVLEKAQEVLGSRALAEEWMTKPALGLDGELPIDLLSNPVGHELVTDFLHRLEYGVY